MRKHYTAAIAIAAAFVPLASAAALGTPQRSDETPPGLAKVLLKGNAGILIALEATEGSNSRLQDLPVSP